MAIGTRNNITGHESRPVKFLLSPSRIQEIYCEYGRGYEDPTLNKEVLLEWPYMVDIQLHLGLGPFGVDWNIIA